MLQPEERADVTHIFWGHCADSAQILWEILGRTRSFARHQRFRDLRCSHIPKKRRTTAEMNVYWPHGAQILQRNVRMARAFHNADLFPTYCDVTSLGSKSRFSRGEHFLLKKIYIYIFFLNLTQTCYHHDTMNGQSEARISIDPTRQTFKVSRQKTTTLIFATSSISSDHPCRQRVAAGSPADRRMTLKLWRWGKCILLFRFTVYSSRHTSAPKSLAASQKRYISVSQVTSDDMQSECCHIYTSVHGYNATAMHKLAIQNSCSQSLVSGLWRCHPKYADDI